MTLWNLQWRDITGDRFIYKDIVHLSLRKLCSSNLDALSCIYLGFTPKGHLISYAFEGGSIEMRLWRFGETLSLIDSCVLCPVSSSLDTGCITVLSPPLSWSVDCVVAIKPSLHTSYLSVWSDKVYIRVRECAIEPLDGFASIFQWTCEDHVGVAVNVDTGVMLCVFGWNNNASSIPLQQISLDPSLTGVLNTDGRQWEYDGGAGGHIVWQSFLDIEEMLPSIVKAHVYIDYDLSLHPNMMGDPQCIWMSLAIDYLFEGDRCRHEATLRLCPSTDVIWVLDSVAVATATDDELPFIYTDAPYQEGQSLPEMRHPYLPYIITL